jgi:hypothetical protein
MSTDSKAGTAALNAFHINGMKPFDTSAEDLAVTSGEQAFALLHVLEAGWSDSGESPGADALASLNPRLHAMALDGIARLVALSLFAGEAAR